MRTNPQRQPIGIRIAALAVPLFFFFLFHITPTQAFTGEPRFSVPIPTVKLTDLITKAEGDATYLYIPWLAQYIAGVYKYALGVAVVIAAVMVIIGGFQYVTGGGDASRVKAGKDRISQAVIGLVLLFGSYMMLQTISPNLLTLDAIKITQIKKEVFNPLTLTDTALATTTTDTGTQGGADAAGPQTTAGPPASTFTKCPVADLPAAQKSDSPNGTRSNAFRTGVTTLSNLPVDIRPRIAAAAEAAVKCQVRMGSCGATAGSIWTIAGLGDNKLGFPAHEKIGTTRWGNPLKYHEIPTKVSMASLVVACNAECKNDPGIQKACGENCNLIEAKEPPLLEKDGKPRMALVVKRNCATNETDAKKRVRELLEADPSMAGWPDSWTSQLEVGDVVIIYNGNSSCGSSHAQVFLGWESEGKARMANGQWEDLFGSVRHA